MSECSACHSDLDEGPLPDGDTCPMFAVSVNSEILCAYCFRMKYPRVYLTLGGKQMLGAYTIEVSPVPN